MKRIFLSLFFLLLIVNQIPAQIFSDVLSLQFPTKDKLSHIKSTYAGHVKEVKIVNDRFVSFYSYNKDGWLTNEKTYCDGHLEKWASMDISYDAKGRPSIAAGPYNTEKLSYNQQGLLCKSVSKDDSGNLEEVAEMEYTPKGNLCLMKLYRSDGSYGLMVTLSYDKRDNLKEYKSFRYRYEGWELHSVTRYFYDSDNRLTADSTKKFSSWVNSSSSTVFNKTGLPVLKKSSYGTWEEYTYDDHNNQLSHIEYNSDSTIQKKSIDSFQYNAKGNPIYRKNTDGGHEREYTYTYTYYTPSELKQVPAKVIAKNKGPQNGNWGKSFNTIKGLAEKGAAASQLKLAVYYQTGTGTEQNDTLAAKWMQKAGAQGNAEAQYRLGFYYETGIGVERNLDKAIEWYEKAAKQNYGHANYELGFCYLTRLRSKKIEEMEPYMVYFEKAAKTGFEPAIQSIASWKKYKEKELNKKANKGTGEKEQGKKAMLQTEEVVTKDVVKIENTKIR